MSSPPISAVLLLLSFTFLLSTVDATVPWNNTFKYVNIGDYAELPDEYIGTYRTLTVRNPFRLCLYNTTPSAYTLAVALATSRSDSFRIWVWEANRGKPVGERAVFALQRDGNMVLAEADGRIVWQTNTANKGVVGFDFLPNGNLVLYDAKRRYIWQSFDYPTDTLVIDQSLKLGGTSKLVSRASSVLDANGPYSLVMEPTRMAMYYTSPVDSQRYLYFSFLNVENGPLKQVTLSTSPKAYNVQGYYISFDYQAGNSTSGRFIFSRPRYNAMYSLMKLQTDGNLNIYIYDDTVDNNAWNKIFSVFSRTSPWAGGCQLPGRCGTYGLCLDDQCVACPTGNFPSPTGRLLGWNASCAAAAVKSCSPNDFYYYQLVGVDHFSVQYNPGDGPMTQDACRAKCTNNCNCKGFFYQNETQKCWAVTDLLTLISVKNSNHVAFIKAPK